MSDIIKQIQDLLDENKELKAKIKEYDNFIDKFDNMSTALHDIRKIMDEFDSANDELDGADEEVTADEVDEVDDGEVSIKVFDDEVDEYDSDDTNNIPVLTARPKQSEDKDMFNLYQRIEAYLKHHNKNDVNPIQIINALSDKHDLLKLKTKKIMHEYNNFLKGDI